MPSHHGMSGFFQSEIGVNTIKDLLFFNLLMICEHSLYSYQFAALFGMKNWQSAVKAAG
jgi:hypothetical protein